MKSLAIVLAMLGIAGCVGTSSVPSTSKPDNPQYIHVMAEKYYGRECHQVPLAKCVPIVYPPVIKEIPSFLGLLKESSKKPPVLTSEDDVWICVTPRRKLLTLDVVRTNMLSKRTENGTALSFDFIQYTGPIEEHPGNMTCVMAFQLGKLPKGVYKVSVLDSYLSYNKIGEEVKATLVPKLGIHPNTFWYEIALTVK